MIPAVSSELLWLALIYGLLAALLLVLCLATRWHWLLKATLVLTVSGFYVLSHQTLLAVSGWPSEDRLPDRFLLLSAVLDEPSPGRNHPGAIHLWVHPLKDNQPVEMPRAFRLPYQKDLQGILVDGLKKARDGNSQMGTVEPVRGAGGLPWLRPAGNDQVRIKLSDVPRAQLPGK